jgi:transketolase
MPTRSTSGQASVHSGVDLRLCGSHAGVEIGADGPSQMALEDLAMMRAVHGSTVLYPSDGTSTVALVEAMARTPGISYLRTTRGGYPGLYPAGDKFPVGGSKVLRSGENDQVALVGAGVTLHEALRAAEILQGEGIAVRVIDCYSVKPVDAGTLTAAAEATGGRIVVAEDHHPMSWYLGQGMPKCAAACRILGWLASLAAAGMRQAAASSSETVTNMETS